MYIIAEIAQAHDGSLGNALKFIEAAKICGADAVKFQAHIASAESTIRDKFRVNIFPQDSSRYDYWRRMEFSSRDWDLINEECHKRNIDLIISPFSIESVDLVSKLSSLRYLKIGSGEISNYELILYCIRTGIPIIISSGMSTWDELKDCADFCRSHSADFSFLQCTSAYPCELNEIGLNNIPLLKLRLNASKVGLSDHSGDEDVGIAACALGSDILEIHICWNKAMFGPDTSSSLDLDQLKRLCKFRDKMNILKVETNKDSISDSMISMKSLFERSLVASRTLQKGEVITATHIAYKKPAGGLPFKFKDKIIGKTLKVKMNKDDPFDLDSLS